MPEVQNVGAVDYAQYQPSQYQETSPEYVSEPEGYDEHADQMRAATKSRLGATILSLAVVGGLALWGGHAWGKKSAKDAVQNYEKAQKAMEEVEKAAQEGNNKWFGENHCGNKLLQKIKDLFKPFKNTAEEAKDVAKKAADDAKDAATELEEHATDSVK